MVFKPGVLVREHPEPKPVFICPCGHIEGGHGLRCAAPGCSCRRSSAALVYLARKGRLDELKADGSIVEAKKPMRKSSRA